VDNSVLQYCIVELQSKSRPVQKLHCGITKATTEVGKQMMKVERADRAAWYSGVSFATGGKRFLPHPIYMLSIHARFGKGDWVK